MKKAIFSLAILVSLSLVFTISCVNNTQPPSGELPAWGIGDTWTTRDFAFGIEGITVQTVTGEQVYNGIDCYIINAQHTHYGTSTTPETVDTSTQAFDKTTLRIIGVTSAPHWLATNSASFIMNTSINYSVKPYPLSIGKTWTTTENITYPIEENQTPTENANYIYKVEGIESITVPAGTFNCFKIVIYNSKNDPIETQWVTDVTGGFPVKRISNQIDLSMELTSYSLSE